MLPPQWAHVGLVGGETQAPPTHILSDKSYCVCLHCKSWQASFSLIRVCVCERESHVASPADVVTSFDVILFITSGFMTGSEEPLSVSLSRSVCLHTMRAVCLCHHWQEDSLRINFQENTHTLGMGQDG